MLRTFVVAFVVSCFVTSAWAQTQPAPVATAPTAATATKPAAKKPAAKARAGVKPAAAAESGLCQIGVIPAIGNQFVVQKIGLMVFGNDHAEVPIDAWALDDLVVARVRAAAPGAAVRRIAYARGAFEPFDNPPSGLFRNPRDDLSSIVRQITSNARCERYLVVAKYTGKLEGTNQTLRGIGVYNHGTKLFSRTSLFANISVTVFDGKTFAIQKSPFGLGSILAGTFARMGRNPLTELDNEVFPEPAAAAASSTILRDRTRALIAANLDKGLPAYLKGE